MQQSSLSNSRTFHHARKNLRPISSHSPFPVILTPWQPLIYLQSLWMCLFWTFQINRMTKYVVFFFVTGFFHLAQCFHRLAGERSWLTHRKCLPRSKKEIIKFSRETSITNSGYLLFRIQEILFWPLLDLERLSQVYHNLWLLEVEGASPMGF